MENPQGEVLGKGWSTRCHGSDSTGHFCAGVDMTQSGGSHNSLQSGWHKKILEFTAADASKAYLSGICLKFPAFRTLDDFKTLQISTPHVCCHK
jgi:hypothetical protein